MVSPVTILYKRTKFLSKTVRLNFSSVRQRKMFEFLKKFKSDSVSSLMNIIGFNFYTNYAAKVYRKKSLLLSKTYNKQYTFSI